LVQGAAVIEPVDPFQRRELYGLKIPPWLASMDDLGLANAANGFGESIVAGGAKASDGGLASKVMQGKN
jgi:hypothetical protein